MTTLDWMEENKNMNETNMAVSGLMMPISNFSNVDRVTASHYGEAAIYHGMHSRTHNKQKDLFVERLWFLLVGIG